MSERVSVLRARVCSTLELASSPQRLVLDPVAARRHVAPTTLLTVGTVVVGPAAFGPTTCLQAFPRPLQLRLAHDQHEAHNRHPYGIVSGWRSQYPVSIPGCDAEPELEARPVERLGDRVQNGRIGFVEPGVEREQAPEGLSDRSQPREARRVELDVGRDEPAVVQPPVRRLLLAEQVETRVTLKGVDESLEKQELTRSRFGLDVGHPRRQHAASVCGD
jgi:hypothetical protein